MTTIGVEEEYLLLDPVTGLPVPLADKVRADAGLGRLVADQEVQCELLQAQVEVATPVCGGHPVAVTDQARYRAMLTQAPQLVAEQLVNGMHVHVAVPSREAGVQVLNRIRVWLPTLTA